MLTKVNISISVLHYFNETDSAIFELEHVHPISQRIARYLEKMGLVERDMENSYLNLPLDVEVDTDGPFTATSECLGQLSRRYGFSTRVSRGQEYQGVRELEMQYQGVRELEMQFLRND